LDGPFDAENIELPLAAASSMDVPPGRRVAQIRHTKHIIDADGNCFHAGRKRPQDKVRHAGQGSGNRVRKQRSPIFSMAGLWT